MEWYPRKYLTSVLESQLKIFQVGFHTSNAGEHCGHEWYAAYGSDFEYVPDGPIRFDILGWVLQLSPVRRANEKDPYPPNGLGLDPNAFDYSQQFSLGSLPPQFWKWGSEGYKAETLEMAVRLVWRIISQ